MRLWQPSRYKGGKIRTTFNTGRVQIQTRITLGDEFCISEDLWEVDRINVMFVYFSIILFFSSSDKNLTYQTNIIKLNVNT